MYYPHSASIYHIYFVIELAHELSGREPNKSSYVQAEFFKVYPLLPKYDETPFSTILQDPLKNLSSFP